MCNYSVTERQEVLNLVLGMIKKGKLFTAFDVTTELRKIKGQFRHFITREVINDLFKEDEMGEYIRDLVDIPGANVPAYVYHDPSVDAKAYLQKGSNAPVAVAKSSPFSTSSQPSVKVMKSTAASDKDGRLNIPVQFLDLINPGCKKKFFVVDTASLSLRVRAADVAPSSAAKVYDADINRLRIPTGLMKKIVNVPHSMPFTVMGTPDFVTIS